MSKPPLYPYIVRMKTVNCFPCLAESFNHAVEQAANACPDDEITEVACLFRSPEDLAVKDAASELFGREGELEFDDDAVVSWSADGGAYVQCWRWIDDEQLAPFGITNPELNDVLYSS